MGGPIDDLSQSGHRFDPDPNMTPIRGPGDYRFTFVWDRVGRDYFVHVPRKYHGQPLPLLIALHEEEVSDDFIDNEDLNRSSEKAGFILVAPIGYPLLSNRISSFPTGAHATWNAGRCCGPAQNHNADDVGFIREVIRRVERQARIDPKRIFAMGFSNGAMMAWRLGCEAPEVRAIAAISGTDNTVVCRPAHPVPVIQFHALNDRNVPFNGGKGGRSTGNIELTSVAASQGKWIGINKAHSVPTRVISGEKGYCDLHRPQSNGAPVELCVTVKGRDNWPATKAINPYKLMWDFFSSL